MQQISSNYKNEIKQPSRHFECRVTIGKNIYTNKSIVDIILDYPQAIDGFSIGNTTSQSLDLTLLNTGEEIYSTNQIKVEIGLQVGSDFEYILMGYYNVDEVSKNDYTIKFTAFDNMMKFETPYFSSLGDKPTLQQVVNELATITGVSFVGSIPSYTVTKLEGYTCREVLSYVASLCGGNALITRDGKFTIKTPQNVEYAITTENHFGLTTEEVPYKLGKVTCFVNSEVELSKGAIGTDSMELSFENPWMTEGILNTIYQQLNGFSYLGFETKWQGDLSLDPYDSVLIQDKKGASHRVPILSQKFTYVGGLTSEIGAKGESKNKNSFSSNGSNTNKMNRLVTEQAVIKEALINKANIQDLEAVSIRTQSLEATTAKIQDAIIDVAHISDLNAVNAKIESLQATDVTIQNAIINKADISELNAAVANINILNADLGVIKHLVNGNLSSENIQAGGITSDKLTIANGFIKDAMIDSLNANKITAGQINTALVQVSSASGNLVINDNTIQIRDANRVRVQIGKDASNDYSMSVWDSSGKLMFDARGLKADAIKDSIIRNDMISAEANIDGTKLNISSVVSSINNSSSTLKASKVQFDGVAQTLEVAFNTLKTQVDTTKTQTESNTTAINVAHGKISTLIQDTTIVKDGVETKLKDEYSRLEQTVSGLNSTIGKQQTIIDDHSGKITSTNSELSTLKQSVNGLSASVSSAQTTINSHTTLINQKADLTAVNDKINSAKNELNTSINKKANAVDVYNKTETYTKTETDSKIKIAKDEINLGVSQTYETKTNVASKIDAIQIGVRNLVLKTDIDKHGVGKWVANSGGVTVAVDSSTTYLGGKTIKVVGNDGSYYNDWIMLERDTVYTYSMMMRSNTAITFNRTNPLHMWVNTSQSTAHLEIVQSYTPSLPANTWQQVYVTFKTPNISEIYYMRPFIYGIGNATVNVCRIQVEKGTKPTDWTPALEDTDTTITNLTQRVTSAESKITDIAITNVVKQNFYTKTETDNQITSKGYQTSSQVQQTVDALQIKFSQSGGHNLLRNGKASLNTNYWASNHGGGISRATDAVYKTCFKTKLPSGIIYNGGDNGGAIRLKNNTHYVYEAMIRSSEAITGSGVAPLHFWCNTTPTGADSPQCTIIDYSQSVPAVNKWTKCYVHFQTKTSGEVWFTPFIYTGGSYSGEIWVTEISLSESIVQMPYTPHPSEIYDGITQIDKDGIKVSTSRGAYTHFSADGMNSYDNDSRQTLGIRNGGITFHPYNTNQLGAYITQSALWGGNVAANGLAISTANNGTYISLGISSLSDANTTLSMEQALTISASDSFQPKGINFWKDVHAHGYGIRQLSHLQLAGSGAIQFDYLNNSPSTIYEAVDNGHSLYVMGGYQMHLGCMDGKGVPKGVIWMQNSTNTHSYTHWDFHNYTMYNMKTATSYANATSHRSAKTYGVSSNVEGIRYLYRNIELIDGKAIRSIPNGYRGCTYDVVSIVCKGRGQAWVESEDETRFEVQGDCLSVNVEIIIYPADDVMMLSTVNTTEAPVLELPEAVTPEIAQPLTNEGVSSCDFWNQYMYSKYLFNLKKVARNSGL